MVADFQADGIWPRTNDRMNRAERIRATATEQVFRTCELMLSEPVAESELRVAKNFSTFSSEKDKSPAYPTMIHFNFDL